MSVRLLSAAWDLSIDSTEKMVLMCLCDYANDEGTCWPSVTTISRKCSKSERTVQAALKWLRDHDFFTAEERSGTSSIYHLNPRRICTPANSAPVQKTTCTPANSAPHPRKSRTLTTNEPIRTVRTSPNGDCASPPGDAPELNLGDEPPAKPELKPEHFVEKWNMLARRLGKPLVRDLTPERRVKLKARIAGYTLEDFREVLGNIERSPFLRGEKQWQGCTFDWVTKKANFQKVLEGNYNG
jgi:hypothetical protein